MRRTPILAAILVSLSCSGGGGGDKSPTSPNNQNPSNPSNPSNPNNPSTPTGPQGPFSLTATTGAGAVQTGPAGFTIPVPFTVRVTNAAGAAAGVTVNWTTTAGTLSAATSTTNASGDATVNFTLGAVVGTQTVTASITGNAATATWTGIVVATSISFATPTASMFVGDSLNPVVTGRDAQGTVLTTNASSFFTYLTRSTAVATTATPGKLNAVADGQTWLVATVTSLNTTVRDSMRVDVYNRIRGRVFTYDDAPLPALRAYTTNGTVTDSVNVNADGTYTLPFTAHVTGNVTEVGIDAVNKTNRTYFPALLPIHVRCATTNFCVNSSLTEEHRLLLVPRFYTVPRGRFQGQVLTVNLDSSMATPNNTGPAFLGASGSSFAQGINDIPAGGTNWSFADQTWVADSFPIAAAMHPTNGQAITAADSIAVWNVLNEIEAILGYDIWTPVNRNPAWNLAFATDQTTVPRKTFLFTFNSSLLSAGVSGGGGTSQRSAPSDGTVSLLKTSEFLVLGWRGTTVNKWGMGSIVPTTQNVIIRDNTQVTNFGLVAHEVMHTLGVFHGCNWVSTQSYCGFAPADGKPTFEDAAYLLLSMQLKKAQLTKQAPYALAAATFGYRVFMRGLPPVVDMTTMVSPVAPSGSGLREDVLPGRRPPR